MVVTNRQKDFKESKISATDFAKAIKSLDLSAISDPEKRKQAIIERVFKIMVEEIKDSTVKKKLQSELKTLEYLKKQMGI
ncbi:hypothetical protein OAP76_00845 [Alphaproteobacteria bacterium]|nr:hypothetical protein [Alphaproteobacteria bacterium]